MFHHVNNKEVDKSSKSGPQLKSPPRGLDDDMWMICLYGLYTEAVNHHRPAVEGRMTVYLGPHVFLERRGRVWG